MENVIETLKEDLTNNLRDTRMEKSYVDLKELGKIVVTGLGAVDARVLIKWINYAIEKKDSDKFFQEKNGES